QARGRQGISRPRLASTRRVRIDGQPSSNAAEVGDQPRLGSAQASLPDHPGLLGAVAQEPARLDRSLDRHLRALLDLEDRVVPELAGVGYCSTAAAGTV